MNKNTLYLAAPYAARSIVKKYAEEAERIGYTCVSSWLEEPVEVTTGTVGAATDLTDAQADTHASSDLRDIASAKTFVLLTSDLFPNVAGLFKPPSGGRHVETGYALAKRSGVIVVGHPENIFHRLDTVTVVPDWHECVLELAARLRYLPRVEESR